MEVIGVLGFVATLIGLWIAWASRNDRLLTEIRDVLIEIRDRNIRA